jgi:hypothetical protein
MGILDKLKPQPRWKHADPGVRLEALHALDDQVELAVLAERDADSKVRRGAVDRVTDPAVLGRVAASDSDSAVQDAAADRLLAIASDEAQPAAAAAAASLLTDSRRLAVIVKGTAPDQVREIALSRLSDERVLGGVARHAKVEQTALAAAARLTSADELLDTVLNSDHKDVALTVFDRVINADNPDTAQLRTIEARTQQKAVARRARTILQAIEDAEAARRAAEEELRKQEGLLCDTVESLKDIADPDRTDADLGRITAAWDTMTQQAASGSDAAAAQRFATGVEAARARIAQRRRPSPAGRRCASAWRRSRAMTSSNSSRPSKRSGRSSRPWWATAPRPISSRPDSPRRSARAASAMRSAPACKTPAPPLTPSSGRLKPCPLRKMRRRPPVGRPCRATLARCWPHLPTRRALPLTWRIAWPSSRAPSRRARRRHAKPCPARDWTWRPN